VLRRQYQHLPEEYFVQFVRRCLAAGLDPWASGLNPEVEYDARSERRKLVFICSINLMRARAAAHPRYVNQRGPMFQRADGNWVDTWTAAEHRNRWQRPSPAQEAEVRRYRPICFIRPRRS